MLTGHEFYQNETESIHIYYILEGDGRASINGTIYDIETGDTIKLPINTEYAFKGRNEYYRNLQIELEQPDDLEEKIFF